MRTETAQEQAFHALLPPELAELAEVSFEYRHTLQFVQTHLQTYYGERADWTSCLKAYFESEDYRRGCHTASRCEDLPLLTAAQLESMLREEETFQRDAAALLREIQTVRDAWERAPFSDVRRAAQRLGIDPEQPQAGLTRWLVRRDGLTEGDCRRIEAHMKREPMPLIIAADLLSSLLEPGMQLTFPHAGTAVTQPKRQYFYRGERAFFGSSRPGIYRGSEQKRFLRRVADYLILNEACCFLDEFDAVRGWQPSTVNYPALAQHYGIKTPLMDLTSDLKTALFFACCTYENGRWRPLQKRDLQAQGGVADPRFGVLYRTPTEITDMQWALLPEDGASSGALITPIGYQPFMRCSAQHGYMLIARDERYDMLRDPLFDKFRFAHDEDFCRWIFEQMDGGAKIYPNEDAVDLAQYMDRIAATRQISRQTFELVVEDLHYTKPQAQELRLALRRAGFTVLDGQREYIHAEKLQKINRRYTAEAARQKLGCRPVTRPMFTLSGNSPVEVEPDGTATLDI